MAKLNRMDIDVKGNVDYLDLQMIYKKIIIEINRLIIRKLQSN